MSGIEPYIRSHSTLDAAGPAWLDERRTQALQCFRDLGFPTTKLEDWKFTSVRPIEKSEFRLATLDDAPAVPESLVGELRSGERGSAHLVFVNGRFSETLSTVGDLPKGVVVASLAQTLRDSPEATERFLTRLAPFEDHAFAALNTAFLEDGAFLYVPEGVHVSEPVYLSFLSIPGDASIVTHPRNLVVAGRGSGVTVVETYLGPEGATYFTNPVTEISAAEDARVRHVKVQRESAEAFHVAVVQASQERDSRFGSCSVSLGGALARNDIQTALRAEGGESDFDGLYLVRGRQRVDHHTTADHQRPHCTSRELYKGILDERSRGVFNGKIIVRSKAEKTDAGQVNRNLILSNQALVNTKPQLEIFNDDVRCTHGATIGRLDEEALFYLRSRGIREADARSLLMRAFADELIERIAIEPVQVHLERILDSWFEASGRFRREP